MADADALFDLAARKLAGAGCERDAAAARELFREAGEAGRHEAAVIHANLLASGTGGPRRWREALGILEELAERDLRCRRELALIGAMRIDRDGDPLSVPDGEVVSEPPEITRFPGLFSREECAYLIAAAEPMLEPSVVVDPASGRQVRDPVRSSDGTGFTWPLENPAVHALNRRIAAASGTAADQGEPLQILRYRPGQEYRPHFDAIPGFANQRILTVLVWLNEDYEGGETHFPVAGLALRGRAGDALMFRNAGADGRRDPASAHAGRPVTRGEKFIASRWIRAARFEPPA